MVVSSELLDDSCVLMRLVKLLRDPEDFNFFFLPSLVSNVELTGSLTELKVESKLVGWREDSLWLLKVEGGERVWGYRLFFPSCKL